MGHHAFGPARQGPSSIGPCMPPVGWHGTARWVGRAVPAQARQGLGCAMPGNPDGHLYMPPSQAQALDLHHHAPGSSAVVVAAPQPLL
jgi:hypothetical protein